MSVAAELLVVVLIVLSHICASILTLAIALRRRNGA